MCDKKLVFKINEKLEEKSFMKKEETHRFSLGNILQSVSKQTQKAFEMSKHARTHTIEKAECLCERMKKPTAHGAEKERTRQDLFYSICFALMTGEDKTKSMSPRFEF